jgi:hypothetical protein
MSKHRQDANFTVAEPPVFSSGEKTTVIEALQRGPQMFGEIVDAIGSFDGRDVA